MFSFNDSVSSLIIDKKIIIVAFIVKKNIYDGNIIMKETKSLDVITGEEYVYTRKDAVKVIPISCLTN